MPKFCHSFESQFSSLFLVSGEALLVLSAFCTDSGKPKHATLVEYHQFETHITIMIVADTQNKWGLLFTVLQNHYQPGLNSAIYLRLRKHDSVFSFFPGLL